jgi:DNA polymerase (family X)
VNQPSTQDLRSSPSNAVLAAAFEETATLLEAQQASPHRVRAWRAGASAIRASDRSMADIFRREGRAGLEAVEHVGHGLASVLIEMLRSGRSRLLERLRGETTPVDLFAELPGIGEDLAERIHHELGIETLEDLEVAAHDGRLARLEGFGPKRVRAVQDVLAARLSRSVRHPSLAQALPRGAADAPSVATLLALDARYREEAAADRLKRIAPSRFNPGRVAWLPILHDERDGWTFTALFSNSALAHQLGRTHDWVLIYFERHGVEGRCTVVTETRGPLEHRRVVRGREAECRRHYDALH